ncbi:sulfite exporter TauE/SafE family protein [Actinomadura parmotrematis]|uniref:Probable membrane transporter protein n=1 Tax=Actinomadura parmotrematis TaxID=2864039 RepID=A0ABS7FRB2_9ACTN|nr:sulfite exporter TauE/SafE family protein [Actinomadura parmotrematis]MBW8482942.1 sulfite exporter TauE/SafE family protein [Actinomadura parmotrematis]
MDTLEAAAVLAAGVAAGGINTLVGSGSLITFPTMVALGFPSVAANVSNNIGLVSGSATGAYGYRAELRGQRGRLLRLSSASLAGALIGAVLLFALPGKAFDFIVPVLIVIALALVVAQPRLQRWVLARRERSVPHGGPWLWIGVLLAGVYGGYFGAAQGIVLIGLLGIALDDDLQRVNAAKNVLSAIVNGTAAVVFVVAWALGAVQVVWTAVLLIAVGSTLGGVLGAKVGRRVPAPVLRGVIVVVGLVALWKFLS